ncbi:MAG: VanZ family protein [Flavisolibacter sp.]
MLSFSYLIYFHSIMKFFHLAILRSKWLAISWFIIMCILFFLPGKDLPEETPLLALIHIDKLFHIALFAGLYFLWRNAFPSRISNYGFLLLFILIFYGYMVEVIQKYWIPGRSYDLFDLIADSTGSITGMILWVRVYKKNKPL